MRECICFTRRLSYKHMNDGAGLMSENGEKEWDCPVFCKKTTHPPVQKDFLSLPVEIYISLFRSLEASLFKPLLTFLFEGGNLCFHQHKPGAVHSAILESSSQTNISQKISKKLIFIDYLLSLMSG